LVGRCDDDYHRVRYADGRKSVRSRLVSNQRDRTLESGIYVFWHRTPCPR